MTTSTTPALTTPAPTTLSSTTPACPTSTSPTSVVPVAPPPPDLPVAPAAPLPYHRLAHLQPRTARWWRPLATLGAAAGLFGGLVVVFVVVVLGLVIASVAGVDMPALSPELDDPRNPFDVALGLGSIAVLLPVVVLAARWGGGLRGCVHSVVGRFRWRMALRAAAVVVPAYAVVIGGLTALAPPADLSLPRLDGSLLAVLLAVLVLTPLQCAAEEYAFRGLPQLLLGTWLRRPVWGVLVPIPLFMAGHGYDWVGQVDIAVFALAMGFLVWKSGGLELAVVVHVANNLPMFLLSPLSPSSLQQGAVDPWALALALPLTLGTTAALTVWVSRTHGVALLEPVRGRGGRR